MEICGSKWTHLTIHFHHLQCTFVFKSHWLLDYLEMHIALHSVAAARSKKMVEDNISKWIFITKNPWSAVIFPLCPLFVCLKCVPPFFVFKNGYKSEATCVRLFPNHASQKV